jgi:hypothetical protein
MNDLDDELLEFLRTDLDRAPVGFMSRARTMLSYRGIKTVSQLQQFAGSHEFRRQPNIGRKTLEHLRHLLEKRSALPVDEELLQSTKEFVASACPNLQDKQRDEVVSKIYNQMRRTLAVVNQ